MATTDLRLLIVKRLHFWRLLDETPELIRTSAILPIGGVCRLAGLPANGRAELEGLEIIRGV